MALLITLQYTSQIFETIDQEIGGTSVRLPGRAPFLHFCAIVRLGLLCSNLTENATAVS